MKIHLPLPYKREYKLKDSGGSMVFSNQLIYLSPITESQTKSDDI